MDNKTKEEIICLFPTTIYSVDISQDFTEEQIELIDKIRKFSSVKNYGNTISYDKNILDNPKFATLKKEIMQHIENYVEKIISPKNKLEVYITQSWVNFTLQNEHHHKHTHPNSFLSGVLYLNVDPIEDKIHFDRILNTDILEIEPKEWHQYNSTTWWLPVSDKKLYLFPSNLPHRVETKQNNNLRISIAFNTFVRGIFGIESNSNYLEL